jgi:hypothetical protein
MIPYWLLAAAALAMPATSSSAAASRGSKNAAGSYSFRGDGGKTLAPIRIHAPSTLLWACNGDIFQIFNVNPSASGGDVNSQGGKGATYLPPGRYTLQVNAIGAWAIKIVPGIERPRRLSAGYVGFRGNGGRDLPPFRTSKGTTLYWRSNGDIFQLFSTDLGGPDVNSRASRGTTYMDAGIHQVIVNALGDWVIYWRT